MGYMAEKIKLPTVKVCKAVLSRGRLARIEARNGDA